MADTPPAVNHALTLHRALQEAVPPPPAPLPGGDRAAIVDVVRQLPVLARHASAAMLSTTRTGQLLAYACDLPPRETHVRHFRVSEYLAGHRRGGLVAVDVVDIAEVMSALRRTENRTAALGHRVTDAETGRRLRPTHDARAIPARVGPAAATAAQPTAERSAHERSHASAHAAARTRQSGPGATSPRR